MADASTDIAWNLLLAARTAGDAAPSADLVAVDGFVLGRRPVRVIEGAGRLDDKGMELVEILLDVALTPRGERHVTAMLGQSLDGFIATRGGQSRSLNCEAALTYQHRVRALADAVIVGASTAALDDPRLTTRHVAGPNPVRVVIDPHGRLPASSQLLHDGAAPSLILRNGAGSCGGRLTDQAEIVHLDAEDGAFDPAAVLDCLAERGLTRVFVEGGGVTVGRFLAAGLIDRLQLLVAPMLLGAGRPAIHLPEAERLEDALRPPSRRHLMGEDVLFDFSLRPAEEYP
ncbi:MAG: RibD family protein [Geminicoccaceae bacterium]